MADAQNRHKVRLGRGWNAVVFPFANIFTLFRLGFFPILIGLGITSAIFLAFSQDNLQFATWQDFEQWQKSHKLMLAVAYNIMWIALTVYSVGICRFIILEKRPKWVFFRFRKYELTSFAIIAIYIALERRLDAWLDWIAPEETQYTGMEAVRIAGVLLAVGLWIWISTRLILLLPHAAVQGRIAPSVSWRAMKGNFWRVILALMPLILAMVLLIVIFVLLTPPDRQTTQGHVRAISATPLLVFYPVVNFLIATFLPAFLSYVYKDLVPDAAANNCAG